MAGDAALGITPVMKWNFERSCYRWLVTRHPAQFERMDFTAQILQSASRARKAFYECGWAEAKVLIRPSDGKFERTPFFDTIIRRGLRNSTRFDASTLTEEEIEALGMHRDETLGFKLQIRQFRNSSRKELPPLGRGGGAGRLRSSTSSSAAPSADSDSKAGARTGSIATAGASSATGSAGAIKIAMNNSGDSNSTTEGLVVAGRTSHPLSAVRASPNVGGDVGGGGGVRCGDARALPDETTHRGRAPGGWGGDGGHVPVSGLGWPDETVWRCGNRVMETSGRRDGWTPREHMGKWDFRSGGGSASNGQRDRYVDSNDDACYPENGVSTPMAMPPWAHPPVAALPNGGSHHPWQSPQARPWPCVDGSERHYRPPMGIFGGKVGNRGDVEPCRPGLGEGDARDCRGGSDIPGGIPSKPFGQQSEADIRTSFPHQVGHIAKRPIGRAAAGPPRLSGGGEALNTPKPADGSLLAQGYLRLAAMNLGREGGDDTRRAIVNNSAPHRYEAPASVIGGAKSCAEDLGGRRPVQTRPVVHYPRPGPPGYTPAVEDGPALKKRRSLDGVNARESAVDGLPQPENSVERGRSNSDAGDIQPWPRGRRASSAPDPQGDLLARELVESERQLDLARHALDEAQTKFEEANRAHKAKREQVFAAAAAATDKQSAERESSLERGASRDLSARTCDEMHDRRGPSVTGRLSHDRPADLSEPRRASSPTPPKPSTTPCADEMREVKREAALLYGIARAPMSSAGSPPRASASAPAATSSECRRTGSPAEPHRRALSQKAPNHAPEGSSARRSPPSPPSPLPNLARAMPSGFGGAREVEEGRQPPARGLAPLGDDCRRGGNVRMRVGTPVNRGGACASVFPPPALAAHPSEVSAYGHRPIAPRGAMSHMYQAPGSPSVNGETDSEHSDSATGVGAAQDDAASHHQHRQEHRDLQGHKQRGAVQSSGFRHAPGRGNQHWGARSVGGLLDGKGEASNGYVAPLARLAAVATAGAQ